MALNRGARSFKQPLSGRVVCREPGDLLCPAREGREELARKKVQLGSIAYAGQYQQRPAPAEGGLLKRAWWRFWYPGEEPAPLTVRLQDGELFTCPQVALPDWLYDHLLSWDCTFKETASADFVVGQAWARYQADMFLLAQTRARLNFPQTVAAVRELAGRYPQANAILIEDKANGAAVISTLQREISGIIPVNPQGGKEARVNAVAAGIEAGNVYLPHPACFPWVHEFIEEAAAFPNAAHDDQVDAMSQTLLRYIQYPYHPLTVSVAPPRPELLTFRPR